MKVFTVLLLPFILASCIFIPTVSRDPEPPGCELFTRELDLAMIEDGGAYQEIFRQHQGCVNEACLAVLAGMLALPATSFIVSGSVVIAGNTLHWIEVQGRCDDGVVQSFIRKLGL